MKLRTIRGPVAPCGTIEDIEHDAAAAHALMQALSEWLGVSTNDECAGNVVTWINNRADELMRQWGFTDD